MPSSVVPVLLVICAICFLKPVKRDSGLILMLKGRSEQGHVPIERFFLYCTVEPEQCLNAKIFLKTLICGCSRVLVQIVD